MSGTFKIFWNNPKKSKFVHEEMKRVVKSWKTSYHSVQNLLSSSLLSKNVKIEMDVTINLPYFVLVWNLVAHIEGGT